MRQKEIVTYTILIGVGMIIFLYQAYAGMYLPYDDAYSMGMIKQSFGQILQITSHDVHPPLYYWGLKAYSLVVGDSLFALRSFSTIGILAMMLLACFPMRRQFGYLTSCIFIVLLILYPTTQNLAIDMRMYSWTAFFVLASSLSAYDVFCRGKVIDWLILTIMALCAAYTHNYGLISVAGVYLLLFIFLLRAKRNILPFLASGIFIFILYIPWLYQLFGQMNSISGNYWIKPLTLGDLFLHIYYFYSPKLIEFPFRHFSKLQMMIGVIIVMASQLLVVAFVVMKCEDKRKLLYPLLAILVFTFPILVGFLFSILVFPILVPRYMLCAFPLFLLALAMIYAEALRWKHVKILAILSLVLLACNGLIRHYTCVQDSKYMKRQYEEVENFVKPTLGGQTNFVAYKFFSFSLSLISELVPDNKYYILGEAVNVDSYLPFQFEHLNLKDKYPLEIILISSEGQDNLDLLLVVVDSLGNHYELVDTMHQAGIFFYKMRAVRSQ